MDMPSMAKSIVAKMGHGAGEGGAGKLPKGITVAHVAGAESILDAYRDGKPTELAGALRDFIRLVIAEGE